MTAIAKVLDELQPLLDEMLTERSLRHLIETKSQDATGVLIALLGTVALWRAVEDHGLADDLPSVPIVVGQLRAQVVELRSAVAQINAGRMDA